MDVVSYILSKKYVEDSLVGAGALKGKSAYEIASENGFIGGPTEWLASLQGDTPRISSKGTWQIGDVDTGVIASPSLAGYATEEFVATEISKIPKLDLTPYATTKQLNEAILGITIPDVSEFVTQEDIDKAIAAIKFPEPDLTAYAKKADIPDVSDFVTYEEVQEAIDGIEHPVVDLGEYAKKDELPSTIGLATEEFVQTKINEIEFPTTDLTGYATEEFVQKKIAEAELAEGEVDLSAYYTKTEVDSKFDNLDIPEQDLTGYATKKDVENAINEIVIPSTEGLATKEFVEEAIASVQIPSVDGLASEQYVDEAIANIEHPTVDLSEYAKKEEIPSVDGLATEQYVKDRIAALVDSAPETLDTIGEIALEIHKNQNVVDALNSAIADKANKSEIPSIEGLASQDYVNEAIAAIEIPETKPDINVYEITSDSAVIDELVALLPEEAEINSGDLMLVTNSIGVKSAYQYDEDWIACDGNVDASKVIMPFDITLAGSYTQVGNLNKTSTGTATFATKGKSVAAALQEMLSKREQPKIKSNPSVSLTATSGAKEVGTSVTPEWTASLNAGSYTYGPATGIVASSWEISDTDGHTASTASGEFDSFIVADDTSYRISAKANYEAGVIAKDNLGDPSNPTIQIAAGNKSANGGYITGYRAWFMYIGGSLDEVDSAFVRNSSNMGSTPATQNGVTISEGTKRIMIAIPQTSTLELTSVIDVDGMGLDVFDNFNLSTVNVEGVDGYQAKPYNVWIAENANGLAATHYNLIIG